ncbi:hypothetical protein [Pseudonocardia acaciae]|uniref:hypothetical protein n=1 Tax=Pseudonocardia acaciae TaxID=551276 RepID=UPI000B1ACCBE|nr:hypothetical protein [Pseudonocardia acaciae]
MIILAAVVVIALATGAFYTARYRRTQRLRERFGPEYEHSVEHTGDRRRAG